MHALLTLTALMPLLPSPSDPGDSPWLAGWAARLEGETIEYESADHDVDRAQLVRSIDASGSIRWQTAALPEQLEADEVSFVWLFGIDVDPEVHEWRLLVDGAEWLRFGNPTSTAPMDWSARGRDGSRLEFRATRSDRYGDLFGYATLSLPSSACRPGEALELEVVGESADSRVWYMTFMEPVQERARLLPRSAVLRAEPGDPPGAWQPVVLDLVHLGEPTRARVEPSLGAALDLDLVFGNNRVELRLPIAAEARELVVDLHVEGRPSMTLACSVEPCPEWTIDLVQHTHTDIGYTRPQTEILPEHLRYIDYALDYCDATDDFPEASRFRWTCEASWAVREYLRSRPAAQIERLRQRVAEGRIEVTGLFFNMSEVMDEASYAAYLFPVREFQTAGLPVVTAMQNDINGAAWCLADYLAAIGVRYLTMGQHGHRALKPFDMATSFWWESPAGNRLLAYRADHYNTGNRWGVHTGQLATVEEGLFRYLAEMEQKGYPFRRVAVQYSGYLTDNSPPALAGNELIRAWNAKYVWPRLRSSLAGDFLAWVEEQHGDELPVHREAWPDWWTDGFGSAARESAAARVTQSELAAVEGLLALETLMGLEPPTAFSEGPPDSVAAIRDSLLFYGEHTFGAAESVTDPLGENSMVQWAQKSAYVWEAVKNAALLREKALGVFQSRLSASDTPTLAVVNTLTTPRAGQLEVYVDHGVLPVDQSAGAVRLVDDQGDEVRAQLLASRTDGSYWALDVPTIPAMGYRTFRIEQHASQVAPDAESEAPQPADAAAQWRLESDHYRIRIDPLTGALASLFDKQLDRELADPESDWGLGQVIHETLGNRYQMEAKLMEDQSHTVASEVVLVERTSGPIWQGLRLAASLPACAEPGQLSIELRLFHHEKRIELHYGIHKQRNFDPEALYVAFPFALGAPGDYTASYETLGGIAHPGVDLLEGASADWQTMQSFAALADEDLQVVLSCDEVPLVQFGDINTGKFRRVTDVARPVIFSWVMNNYWTTNYRASQEGEFRWSYALTSSSDTSSAFASRFGASHRVPLLARVLPAGSERTATVAASLLEVDAPNLVQVSARPATRGEGIVVLLREVEGRATEARITSANGQALDLYEVDVLERDLSRPRAGVLAFEPFEPKFIRVVPRASD